MNLGEALRHMVDFFAPRGEWINGHTLYTHFPKDEWGYSSLRKECAYAGLSVQDVHSNLWFVCTPPNAHIALRRVVEELQECRGAWVQQSRVGFRHRRADWKYSSLRDECIDAGLTVSDIDCHGQWRVASPF